MPIASSGLLRPRPSCQPGASKGYVPFFVDEAILHGVRRLAGSVLIARSSAGDDDLDVACLEGRAVLIGYAVIGDQRIDHLDASESGEGCAADLA